MEKRPLVLVVEDDADSLEMFVHALGGAGFQVDTAVDGVQGAQKAMSLRPEVIVADLRLPELDGWAMTRRLKMNARTKDIPVIALSGQYILQELFERTRAAGFTSCLLKPCAPADLVGAVRAALIPTAP